MLSIVIVPTIHCHSDTSNISIEPLLWCCLYLLCASTTVFLLVSLLLSWYTCYFHDIHCISATDTKSIVATPLMLYPIHYVYSFIYQKIPLYSYVSVIISPPWSPLYQIFCHHCCSYNSDVYISPHLWRITVIPDISVLQLGEISVFSNWFRLGQFGRLGVGPRKDSSTKDSWCSYNQRI